MTTDSPDSSCEIADLAHASRTQIHSRIGCLAEHLKSLCSVLTCKYITWVHIHLFSKDNKRGIVS